MVAHGMVLRTVLTCMVPCPVSMTSQPAVEPQKERMGGRGAPRRLCLRVILCRLTGVCRVPALHTPGQKDVYSMGG